MSTTHSDDDDFQEKVQGSKKASNPKNSATEAPSVRAIYYRNGCIGFRDMIQILQNPEKDLVSSTVVKLGHRMEVDGETYVYRESAGKPNYWLYDGGRWTMLRTEFLPKHTEKEIAITHYELQLPIPSASTAVKTNRIFLKRYVATLAREENGKKCKFGDYVLVRYHGNVDFSRYEVPPHKNTVPSPKKRKNAALAELEKTHPEGSTPKKKYVGTKVFETPESMKNIEKDAALGSPDDDSDRPHVQTDKSVRVALREKIQQGHSASSAHRQVLMETSGEDQPEFTPRNIRQAHNIKAKIVSQRDEIFATVTWGNETPGVLQYMDIHDGINIVTTHPQMIDHLNQLFRFMESSDPIIFFYDTTYSIGPFFLSMLSFQHPSFKGNRIVLLASLIHTYTERADHEPIFYKIRKLVPNFNSSQTVLVTDREGSILNAVKAECPLLTHVYCWNHIRKNVKNWTNLKFGGAVSDALCHDVFRLLDCETIQQYENVKESVSVKWPTNFQKYYSSHIQKAILKSGRWILEVNKVYQKGSGVTNNSAEAENKIIKEMLAGKGRTTYSLVLGLYFLQSSHTMEIRRGFQKLGDFKLLPDYQFPASLMPGKVPDCVNISVIPDMILKGEIPADPELYPSKPLTHFRRTEKGLAEYYILRKRITFVPESKVFTVVGLANRAFMVDLSKRSCTCLKRGECSHYLAVLMFIGLNEEAKSTRTVSSNLGRLMKSVTPRRSGKKGPGLLRIPYERRIYPLKKTVVEDPATDGHREDSNRTSETQTLKTAESSSHKASSVDSLETSGIDISESLETHESVSRSRASNSHQAREALKNTSKDLSKEKIQGMHPIILKLKFRLMEDLPKLTRTSVKHEVFKFPFGSINLLQLKTISSRPESSEVQIIEAQCSSKDERRWIHDFAIDGFLYQISNPEFAITLTTAATKVLFSGSVGFNQLADFLPAHFGYHMDSQPIDYTKVKRVLLPRNIADSHWIVYCLYTDTKQVTCLDPLSGRKKLTKQEMRIFEGLTSSIYPNSPMWTESTDVAYDFPLQKDMDSCGIFILYYAVFLMNNLQIPVESFNTEDFRYRIYGTICGFCTPTKPPAKKICKICKKNINMKDAVSCFRCSDEYHRSCIIGEVSTIYICSQ